MRIYAGNLSYDVTEEELQKEFAAFGQVASVTIPSDGRSKGFGFVEMPNKTEAEAAIAGLNGKNLRGRPVTVNEARPRVERPGGGERRERRF